MSNEIVRRLKEHFEDHGENPLDDTDSDLCTTIGGQRQGNPDGFWIQLHRGMINFKHLDESGRDGILAEILDELEDVSDVHHDAGVFMSFPIADFEPEELEGLLTALVDDYYKVEDPAAVEFFSEVL